MFGCSANVSTVHFSARSLPAAKRYCNSIHIEYTRRYFGGSRLHLFPVATSVVEISSRASLGSNASHRIALHRIACWHCHTHHPTLLSKKKTTELQRTTERQPRKSIYSNLASNWDATRNLSTVSHPTTATDSQTVEWTDGQP